MNYTILDFETATRKRASACSIGIIRIVDGRLDSSYSRLIKPSCFPDFDIMNMMIHGIRPKDVESEPEFDVIWNEIKHLIQGQVLVAHNAAFDISVLNRTLQLYNIEIPEFKYLCTYRLSKSIFQNLPSYSLDYLADYFGIKFKHHDALEDCKATRYLLDKLIAKIDEETLRHSIKESHLFGKRVRSQRLVYDIKPEEGFIDESHMFFKKEIIFTGTLVSMPRKSAQQLVVNIGGIIGKTLNMRTSFLIVGQQDFKIFGADGRSAKQKKAEQLSLVGHKIEILSEQEFINLFE